MKSRIRELNTVCMQKEAELHERLLRGLFAAQRLHEHDPLFLPCGTAAGWLVFRGTSYLKYEQVTEQDADFSGAAVCRPAADTGGDAASCVTIDTADGDITVCRSLHTLLKPYLERGRIGEFMAATAGGAETVEKLFSITMELSSCGSVRIA